MIYINPRLIGEDNIHIFIVTKIYGTELVLTNDKEFYIRDDNNCIYIKNQKLLITISENYSTLKYSNIVSFYKELVKNYKIYEFSESLRRVMITSTGRKFLKRLLVMKGAILWRNIEYYFYQKRLAI